MKSVKNVVFICFLALTGFSLMSSGISAWANEEGLIPTVKSLTPVDSTLLNKPVADPFRANWTATRWRGRDAARWPCGWTCCVRRSAA